YAEVRTGKVNASTLHRIETVLTDFTVWSGYAEIAAVTKRLAGQYIAEVIVPAKTSYKTKAWQVSALRRAWRYFLSREWAEVQPWDGHLENYRESSRGDVSMETARRPYTEGELALIREKLAPDDPLYQTFVLCLHSAARVEEIASLAVGDVDLEAGTMKVRKGKNRNSLRTLIVHPTCKPILETLIAGKA